MSKLTDSQLVLLSSAAQRKDHIVVPPPDAEGKAATRLFKPLLKQRLVEEIPAHNGHPVFRRDPDGDVIALRITDEGLAAIGVDAEETQVEGTQAETSAADRQHAAGKKSSRKPGSSQKKPKGNKATVPSKTRTASKGGSAKPSAPRAERAGRSEGPRAGSKQALLITMLHRKQGADIDAIVRATDWLPHTARAVISGLRKAGYEVELERKEGAKSVYRIVGGPKRAAGRKPA
jgi:hypothetical protein